MTTIARVDETSALTANKEKVGAALSALKIAPHFGHIRLEDPGVPVSDHSSDRRVNSSCLDGDTSEKVSSDWC